LNKANATRPTLSITTTACASRWKTKEINAVF
jgi:hypothetical protein